MLEYRRPGRFEAAILPTGSIILLPDREAVVTALGNLHDSLRPGGVLYVDVPAPRLSTDTGPLRRYWNGDSELLTLQNMHTDVDAAAQRVTTWLRYERWRDGRLTDTRLQIGGMLWFGMAEFTDLLRRAGFGDVTVYGDYGDDAPEAESGMWTFEARRAE
ncbi:hypothetical protein [Stackebrandtia albiflava]|uniref:hypothetical protein n=1 Tax=Stackebrandtia albiflava TaxID=406432 RepID=UPI001B882D71|nr:hypothetical protein [Stackebrandtia albiflava]